MADFVTIAPVEELPPGERMVIELGRAVIVVFNVGGQFYAVENNCSHEDYELDRGDLVDHTLECPKHGAQFDIRTGMHLCAPAVSPIKAYDVRVEHGEIQIATKPRAKG